MRWVGVAILFWCGTKLWFVPLTRNFNDNRLDWYTNDCFALFVSNSKMCLLHTCICAAFCFVANFRRRRRKKFIFLKNHLDIYLEFLKIERKKNAVVWPNTSESFQQFHSHIKKNFFTKLIDWLKGLRRVVKIARKNQSG